MAAGTYIDLPRLVDLALGTPESGSVNFNVLHALLHSIVQLLNAENVRVDLIDTPICKPETPEDALASGIRQMYVEEYKVDSKRKDDEKKVLVKKPLRDVEKLIVIRKTTKEDSTERPIDTPRSPESPQKLESTTQEDLNKTDPKTVADLEQVLNVAKRMDQADNRFNEIEHNFKKLWNKYENLESMLNESRTNSNSKTVKDRTEALEKEKVAQITEGKQSTKVIKSLSERIEPEQQQQRRETLKANSERESQLPRGSEVISSFDNKQISAIEEEVRNIKSEIDQIKKKIQQTFGDTSKFGEKLKSSRTKGDLDCSPSVDFYIEKECNNLVKNLNHKFEVFSEKFLTMGDRLLDVEKEISELAEDVEAITKAKDGKTSQVTLTDLYREISEIKSFVHDTMKNYKAQIGDKNAIMSKINELSYNLLEISKGKIDRDDIEELLSEKVDYNMLQHKVSIDHFDATRRDLESLLLETLRKMQERDDDWCKTIEFLKKEVQLKLNATEITALRDYFEKRLQSINNRISVLHAEKKEPEAAGTCNKVIKDLFCISCNRYVLMKREETNKVAQLKSLAPHKSIKPLLSYELDNIRRQIKDQGKNLHYVEAELKDHKLIMDNKAQQICSRYCGGSHTIITAKDRVAKGISGRSSQKGKITVKCICTEETAATTPCPCPEAEEKESSECVCPEEPEVCSCPSSEDPLEKCATERQKRCVEIDRHRREVCAQEERSFKKCKENILERRGKCEKYLRKRQKCTAISMERARCESDVEKRNKCQIEMDKYKKCVVAERMGRMQLNAEKLAEHERRHTPFYQEKSIKSLNAENQETLRSRIYSIQPKSKHEEEELEIFQEEEEIQSSEQQQEQQSSPKEQKTLIDTDPEIIGGEKEEEENNAIIKEIPVEITEPIIEDNEENVIA